MIPFVLDQAECDAFGHKVYRFDQAVDLKPSYDKLVYLDKLVQPLILIKPGRVYVKACAVCNVGTCAVCNVGTARELSDAPYSFIDIIHR